MIRALSKGFPGLTVECEFCQSLIAYTPNDIQNIPNLGKRGFTCPICAYYILVDIIDEEEENGERSNNSEV